MRNILYICFVGLFLKLNICCKENHKIDNVLFEILLASRDTICSKASKYYDAINTEECQTNSRHFYINPKTPKLSEREASFLKSTNKGLVISTYTYAVLEDTLFTKKLNSTDNKYSFSNLTSHSTIESCDTIGIFQFSQALISKNTSTHAVLHYKFLCGSACGYEEFIFLEIRDNSWIISEIIHMGEY